MPSKSSSSSGRSSRESRSKHSSNHRQHPYAQNYFQNERQQQPDREYNFRGGVPLNPVVDDDVSAVTEHVMSVAPSVYDLEQPRRPHMKSVDETTIAGYDDFVRKVFHKEPDDTVADEMDYTTQRPQSSRRHYQDTYDHGYGGAHKSNGNKKKFICLLLALLLGLGLATVGALIGLDILQIPGINKTSESNNSNNNSNSSNNNRPGQAVETRPPTSSSSSKAVVDTIIDTEAPIIMVPSDTDPPTPTPTTPFPTVPDATPFPTAEPTAKPTSAEPTPNPTQAATEEPTTFEPTLAPIVITLPPRITTAEPTLEPTTAVPLPVNKQVEDDGDATTNTITNLPTFFNDWKNAP